MRAFLVVALASAATSCTTTVAGCDTTVLAGDDLQAALIEAREGDTICLGGEHTFSTEVSIAVDGLSLLGTGADTAILDFAAQDTGANGLSITADGVTVASLTIRDTPGDGLRASDVDGLTLRDVTVWWTEDASVNNGAYGLYPVGSRDVLIEDCLVKGARDAGIYVGQSENVLLRDNEAWGNVAGIEIENTTGAEVTGNHAHDNTAGILVFNLPDLPVQDGKRAKVHGNTIVNNNLPNFAEEGTVVADVPSGIGVMVLASDDNEIHDNTITGNDTTGVLILSYSVLVFGNHDDSEFDEWAEGNWVHDNTLADNGAAPDGDLAGYIEARPVPDLVWDGCVSPEAESAENCFSGNGDADYYDVDICGLTQDQSTDIGPVTCENEPLPGIEIGGA